MTPVENIKDKENITGKEFDNEGQGNTEQNKQPEHDPKNKKKKDKRDKAAEEALNQAQARYNELNDKYIRLYSEFDNFRRRTLKEKTEMSKTAAEEIILSLLPVVDDLERALKSTVKTTGDQEIIPKEGIDLIYQKFRNLLIQRGLEAIPAVGATFDVDYHDALTNIPVEKDEMKGKVVDEIERGYKLNGKVIRYAKVVVGS